MVPRARRQPLSGIVTVDVVASSSCSTISDRAPRMASAAGAWESSALTDVPRCACSGSEEARSTRWRARRSWSQTAVWSAPKSRLTPWQKMSSAAVRFSVADRLWPNSSSTSRTSRCSSSLRRRRQSSSAVRNVSATPAASARRAVVVPPSSPTTSSPTLRVPCASGKSQALDVFSRDARSGICLAISVTSVGDPRENASFTSAASAGPGLHGSVCSASRPNPDVACRTPLRGLCSKSREQVPPRRLDRALMQRRQQIDQAGRARQKRDEGHCGGAGACRIAGLRTGEIGWGGRLWPLVSYAMIAT